MYEIYAKLKEAKGVSDYQVAKDLGLARSMFTGWKNKEYEPKHETLSKIADYFGVDENYLRTGKHPEKLSETGTKYYFDDETAAKAQELFENPDLRILFDAARDSKPEDLQMAADLLTRLKETSANG